jgi:hypothetical protein
MLYKKNKTKNGRGVVRFNLRDPCNSSGVYSPSGAKDPHHHKCGELSHVRCLTVSLYNS